VGFVKAGPGECGPEDNEDQRAYTAIYDQFPARDSLDQGVWVLFRVVVEREHSVEWFGEELFLF
jgi:hypothetical protein